MTRIGSVGRRIDDLPWLDGAACAGPAGEGVDFFSDDRAETARAITVCQTCPVAQVCRASAEARHETHGVWGGRRFRPQGDQPRPEEGKVPASPPPASVQLVPATAVSEAVTAAVARETAKADRARQAAKARADRRVARAVATERAKTADVVRGLRRELHAVAPDTPAGASRSLSVDAGAAARLSWAVKWCRAYLPDAPTRTVRQAATDAVEQYTAELIEGHGITVPSWWDDTQPDRWAS